MKRTDLTFRELPIEYKKALLEYNYMRFETLEEVEAFYTNRILFTMEIIHIEEAKKRCMEFPFDAGDFKSFNEYHEWYSAGGDVPDHGDSMYPVIEGGVDEWLDDGWHSFHSYVKKRVKEIPVLIFQ